MSQEINLLKPFEKDILGRESYEYFKKNKKFNSKQIDDYYKWKRILTSFLLYFKELLIVGSKGVYIRDIGYFYFKPKKTVFKEKMKFKKVKVSTVYELEFIPDYPSFKDWKPEFEIVSKEEKTFDLEALEFLKAQTLNGTYINKRALRRGRK